MVAIKRYIFQKKWIIIALIIIGAAGWFYYYNQAQKNAKNESHVVRKQTIKNTLSFSGEVSAEEHVILKFQTTGQIGWVGVKEGESVKKYQAIASLDWRLVERNFQKYLNTYSKYRNTFDQSEDDNQDTSLNGSTQEVRDAAKRLLQTSQADLDNSVLDVEIQNLAKQYSTLVSPFDGLVISANPQAAGVNTALDTAYEIVNPASLYFSASVDQTDVVKLKKGMAGEIIFDAYPDHKIRGVVASISYTPKAGETGTVYEVKIGFDPSRLGAYAYRLGMTGDIEFILSQKEDVLAIPSQFIKTEGATTYVYKQEGNAKKQAKVVTGEEIDGTVEITQGLKAGDTVFEFPKK
ncbi:hypothetical protein A2966_00300 [Candidatus Roizmanbacteria bacterium RIFCSPLOWO2_01_FULL_41_22]|uniref:RND efflux pump membrane fusion protein barrel-sandwich domain-containing protein n=2 Tax=Candidatus Roizmaniibacteriota TaxID=1752723 RepID=A0A1F7J889_9BACT|nr:MAG: hypothetical protein A2966_00300 [Candidatus Roizmanbacteria bacterium RIFCSPLOWO2_01_FULL_41_22]